ncbi:MAG: peptide chain release factor aRF-1 [Desulfurococcaceae archaeon]|nr:peptide chain release factor aRF-1 [Desulfurococcaceae archaeon]
MVKELKNWKAHATTLLSLYVPPGRPVSDVINMLRQELAITDNIKLKRTKDRVQRALTAAIDRLSNISKIPQNGLVLFAGENDDTGEFICLMFSPPDPVTVYFYRTDKYFHLEFLEDMLEESDVYGLIVIERDEATIGLLKGSSLIVLEEVEGYVPGKHSKGGQSQRRYDRIIEELVEEFYKRVGEIVNKHFIPYLESGKLKGILIGGPGYAKLDFVKGDYIDYRLKEKVLDTLVDVGSQGEPGLKELVMRASELIKGQKYVEVVNALEEFKFHLAKDDGLALYGFDDIVNALNMGAVKSLVVTEDMPELEKLMELAKKSGAEVYVLPETIPEYVWIKKTFNGVVAILRYKIV